MALGFGAGIVVSLALSASIGDAGVEAEGRSASTTNPPQDDAAEERAQEAPDLEALRAELLRLREELRGRQQESDERISALEREIASLRGQVPEEDLDALLAGGGADLDDLLGGDSGDLDELLAEQTGEGEIDLTALSDVPVPSSGGGSFQNMNPNISAIVDFLGHASNQNNPSFDDQFLMREVELSFSAAVDTYARADIYASIAQDGGDWAIGIEEAYATFLTIPHDLQPRLGRFRSTFGKANTLHLHALPYVEYPLVLQTFFGPDGLYGTGVGVNWLIPNPWDKFFELTYELANADGGMIGGVDNPVLPERAADGLMHLVHLKGFFDTSDASTVETGLSFATIPNDDGLGVQRATYGGLDLTYRWRPPRAGLYNAVMWQTELLAADVKRETGSDSSWGMYSVLDYQFDRRWTVGGRFDFSEYPDRPTDHRSAYQGYLTFIQSEFLFWRLAYRYSKYDDSMLAYGDEHQLFLQCNFGIGPHRAHKY